MVEGDLALKRAILYRTKLLGRWIRWIAVRERGPSVRAIPGVGDRPEPEVSGAQLREVGNEKLQSGRFQLICVPQTLRQIECQDGNTPHFSVFKLKNKLQRIAVIAIIILCHERVTKRQNDSLDGRTGSRGVLCARRPRGMKWERRPIWHVCNCFRRGGSGDPRQDTKSAEPQKNTNDLPFARVM